MWHYEVHHKLKELLRGNSCQARAVITTGHAGPVEVWGQAAAIIILYYNVCNTKKRIMLFNRTVDPLYPCATRTFIDGKFTYSSKRLSEDDFYGFFFSVITDSSPWPDSNQCGTERSGSDPEQGGGREALHCVFKLQWNPSGGARLLDHCVRALITLEEPVPRYHAGRGLVVLDTGWFCLRLKRME